MNETNGPSLACFSAKQSTIMNWMSRGRARFSSDSWLVSAERGHLSTRLWSENGRHFGDITRPRWDYLFCGLCVLLMVAEHQINTRENESSMLKSDPDGRGGLSETGLCYFIRFGARKLHPDWVWPAAHLMAQHLTHLYRTFKIFDWKLSKMWNLENRMDTSSAHWVRFWHVCLLEITLKWSTGVCTCVGFANEHFIFQ